MTNDLCDLLLAEYQQWYQGMAKNNGRLPRTLSGISERGLQFIAILDGLNKMNHVERDNLIKTALQMEQSVAYAYGTLVAFVATEEGPGKPITTRLRLVAASHKRFLMEEYEIEQKDGQNSIMLKSTGVHTGSDPCDCCPQTSFLVNIDGVPENERKRFKEMWKDLRKGVQYKNRSA